jgi:hypothetical protein
VEFERLSLGEAIAGASGLALFVVMFLPWFSEDATVETPGMPAFAAPQESHNAWQALGLIDVLLLLVIGLAVGLALARAAGANLPDGSIPPALIVTAAGLLAVLLILYRLANPPEPTIELSVGEPEIGRQVGILLGLLAASGISFGGYLALTGAGAREALAKPSAR